MIHSKEIQIGTSSEDRSMEANQGLAKQARFLLCLVVCSVISYYMVSHFVVTAVIVQGRSMSPTLHDGDHYLLNRCVFWFREPRRGDLVVVRDLPHSDFAVKRIVAMPGETIEMKGGRVFINGQELMEPYLSPEVRTYSPGWQDLPVNLEQGNYFVMGDNRPQSEDSRSYGPLVRGQIVGLLVK